LNIPISRPGIDYTVIGRQNAKSRAF